MGQFDQRSHALTGGQAGQCHERRGKVGIDGDRFLPRAGLNDRQPAHEEWHLERRLIHEALVVEPMVAEEKSLVAGVNYNRVLTQAIPVNPLQ